MLWKFEPIWWKKIGKIISSGSLIDSIIVLGKLSAAAAATSLPRTIIKSIIVSSGLLIDSIIVLGKLGAAAAATR